MCIFFAANDKKIVLIFFYSISGCNSQSQDKVDQHTRIQSAFEGDTVTIDCTYQTTYTGPTLFWYQQKGNGNPKHMLNKFSKSGNSEEEFKERFHATLNKTSVPLMIQDVCVSDSAVYYCALKPTVTETLSTLIQKLVMFTCTYTKISLCLCQIELSPFALLVLNISFCLLHNCTVLCICCICLSNM